MYQFGLSISTNTSDGLRLACIVNMRRGSEQGREEDGVVGRGEVTEHGEN